MNSFNFQVVPVDAVSSIPVSFPDHICYFTEETGSYYIWKSDELKEIFVDTTSLTWTGITNTPTTVTGYGIVDAVKVNNGTVNYVAKFTPDGTTIGNSLIQDNATNISVNTSIDTLYKFKVYSNSNDYALGGYNNKVGGVGVIGYSNGSGAQTGVVGISNSTSATINIGVTGTALGGATAIGIKGFASGVASLKYGCQLQDGTEEVNKFLKSVTSDGKANWANITVSDVTNAVGSTTGTNNYVAKFTPDGTTIGNSQIQDDGTKIGINSVPQSDVKIKIRSSFETGLSALNTNGGTSIIGTSVGVSPFSGSSVGVLGSGSGNNNNTGVEGTATGTADFNKGVIGSASGATINIGGFFQGYGGTSNYSIQLQDGTQGSGKFLKSITSDGKANWANITTADIQGYQASSFSLSESKAIFVDATYGNNTTGTKYDPSKPFLTWSAALAVAVAGDWIVFNAGSYSQAMTPLSNVNVFCKPGVIFSAGFSITTSTTWRLHGYAIFDATTPLVITSSGATHDIYFEFDRTIGLCNAGVECNDLTSAMLRLTYNCNYLTASRPLRFDNNAVGATYDVVVNVSQRITGYGDRTIFLPSSFAAGSIFGSIIINANIIENTSSSTVRQILWFSPTNTNNFQMYINAKVIRATSTSFTDPGASNVSCVLFYEGGDNINISANIDAGELPCIVNRSQGGTPIYGNMTVTGNIFSKREIVQQYQKQANGNGWHDITIKNGFIHSKGLGLSNAMLHRENNWNSVMWGIPGNTKLVDCIIYNENTNASATATIIKDDLLDVGKNNNFQLYNCLAFVETSGFLATSVQSTKYISAHNVRTNRALGATVLDGFSPSGVIVDTNLTIPKTNINV